MASLMTRLGLAATLALNISAADAAILTISDGDVLISDGGAYSRVAGTVEVAVGTSIIVNPGGAAVLAYAPGCAMAIPTGSITTVAAATGTDGCPITEASTSSQITTQAAGVAGAAGAAGGAGGAGGAAGAAGGAGAAAGGAGAAAGAAGAATGAATISASTIAVGAVGAGAVATAAVTTNVIAGGSQKPASP